MALPKEDIQPLAENAALKTQARLIADIEDLSDRVPQDDFGDAITQIFDEDRHFDPKLPGARERIAATAAQIAKINRSKLAAQKTALWELLNKGGDLTIESVMPTYGENPMIQSGATRLEPDNRSANPITADPVSRDWFKAEYGPDKHARLLRENAKRMAANTPSLGAGIPSPRAAAELVIGKLAENAKDAAPGRAYEQNLKDFEEETARIGLTPQQMQAFKIGQTIELLPEQQRAAMLSKSRILSEMAQEHGRVGPPSKYGFNRDGVISGVAGTINKALQFTGRGIGGAQAGALAALGDITSDIPIEAPPAETPVEKAKRIARGILTGIAIGPPAAVLGGLPGAWAASTVAQAVGAPGTARVAGVPMKEATLRVLKDPSKLADVAKSAGLYAKLSATSDEPQAPTDYTTGLQNAQRKYEDTASAQVMQELPPPPLNASEEEKAAWLDHLNRVSTARYQQLVESDVGGVEHPYLAGMAHETLLDPQNVVNPGSVARGVWAGVKKISGAEALARRAAYEALSSKAVQGVGTISRHPVMNRLAPMGAASEELGTAADILKMQEGLSEGTVARAITALKNDPRNALFDKLSDENKRLLYTLREANAPDEMIPEALKPANDWAKELKAKHQDLRAKSGAGLIFGESEDVPGQDVLKESWRTDWEVPHRIMANDPNVIRDTAEPIAQKQRSLVTGSARERKGKAALPDVGAQWQAEWNEVLRAWPSTARLKWANETLGANVSEMLGQETPQAIVQAVKDKAILTVPRPQLSAADENLEKATRVTALRAKAGAKMLGVEPDDLILAGGDLRLIESAKIAPEKAWLAEPATLFQKRIAEQVALLDKEAGPTAIAQIADLQKQAKTKAAFDRTIASIKKGTLEVGASVKFKAEQEILDTQIQELRAELRRVTNADWDLLPPTLDDLVQQHAGQAGTTIRGKEALLVPAPVKQMFADIHLIVADKAAWRDATKFLEEVNSRFVYQLHRLWRVPKTTLNPAFVPGNLLSVPGLAGVAKGAEAINPKIFGMSLAHAFGAGALGSEKARDITIAVDKVTGKPIKWGRVVDLVSDLALDGMFTERLAYKGHSTKLPPTGVQGLLEKGTNAAKSAAQAIPDFVERASKLDLPGIIPEKITKHWSPSGAANSSENFQHMVGFGLFFDEDSPAGIARAYTKHNEFFANYRLMSPTEKLVLTNAVGFYPWARFVAPWFVKNLLSNPQRFAPYARGPRMLEAQYGKQMPVRGTWSEFQAGRQSYTSPPEDQPVKLKEQTAKLGDMTPGSHNYGVTSWKFSPMSIGVPYMQELASLFGADPGYDDRGTVRDQLSWLMTPLIQMAMRRDPRTDKPITELFPMPRGEEDRQQWLQRLKASGVGAFAAQFSPGLSDAAQAAYKLYFAKDPVSANEFALRALAGRQLGFINELLGLLSGKGDQSVGSWVFPVTPLNVEQTVSRMQRQSVEDIKNRKGMK